MKSLDYHRQVSRALLPLQDHAKSIRDDFVRFEVQIEAKDGRKTTATYAQVLNEGWSSRMISWLNRKSQS